MTTETSPPRQHHVAPSAVLALALMLSVAAAVLVASMSRSRDAARFANAVDGAMDRIVSRISAYETLLRAGAAFVSASEDVRVEEFETYVTRFNLSERYPGVQGIGFTVRVRPEGVDSVVAAQRASRFPDFRFWPDALPVANERHAIVYLFPLDVRNSAAIGYDMYSEPVRRAAMTAARDLGRSVMSGRVRLVQEIEGPPQAGFLIYSPVYRGGAIPTTVDDRRERLQGFVYAPFRADDLFEGIFGSEVTPYVAFEVYDGVGTAPERLLHDSRVQGIAPAARPGFSVTDTLEVTGRPWTVTFTTTPAFEAQSRHRIWLMVLLLGVMASGVLYAVSRRQAAARADAEALALRLQQASQALERQVAEVQALNQEVEERNRDLAHANLALRDSNERLVTLREEADRARDEARLANQAKSDFLAAMSHELRTPLNAIMGYAELIALGIHGPVTDEQRHALDRIRRSQVHLLGLINDVLNYAKLEAGRVEVQREPVRLGDILPDLQAMTEPQVAERGLQSTFTRCDDGAVALGDADKIQQILLNLLTNAIKFTEPGGRIDVRCATDGDEVIIRVLDTGRGIPEDRLQAIFDPFIQIDRGGGQQGQHGVGLGLAISRDLAELMGGRLSAESHPGRGSVFCLRLPRAHATTGAERR